MEKTFVLITDAHRARCFERDASNYTLTELADFVHPQTTLVGEADGGDLTGAAGKGHGRTGHAGTQFEPQTQAQAKERASFARQLAHYLNEAVAAQRCDDLVLIATKPMLGQLRPHLSVAADKALRRCVTSDLTHYQGPELKQRVDQALHMPA